MLKREHLQYRISTPNIKPRFQDPASLPLQELAGSLINIYSEAVRGKFPRHQLEELSAAIVRSSFDVKTAAGLNKLLLDRCVFAHPREADYPATRRQFFLEAAQEISAGRAAADKLSALTGDFDLYGDLPEFEVLQTFAPLTAESLLHRFNLAQAQGVLFYASSLRLTVKDTDFTELRKLLKAIKFFRLLGNFHVTDKQQLAVEISGPYSLFGPSAKYALQLANLLPAIANLTHWKLEAGIRWQTRDLTLKLSDKNGFVSHYRNLAAYIPEEIRTFHRIFKEKQDEWEIIGETPFLDGGEQEIIFPDLSFRSRSDGRVIHLELFHRWHASQLHKRIAFLAGNPELPLLLGIDRSLVRDQESFEALFADCPQIRSRCWLFRDFPGVSSTLNALKKASAPSIPQRCK